MISDGECAEGSIWESLSLALNLGLENLKIIVNANGWGAYDPIHTKNLLKRIKAFDMKVIEIYGHDYYSINKGLKIESKKRPLVIFAKTIVEQFPFLNKQDAHYYVMNEKDYKLAVELLK